MTEETDIPSLVKQSGSNFSLSFFFLPKAKREAIRSIYAFCRVVDDIVDEADNVDQAGQKLDQWRREVSACYSGQPSFPLALALQRTIERFGIPEKPLQEIISGVRMDLTIHRYETFESLRTYCDKVAGAVGLACMRVFGPEGDPAEAYALQLGLALQLINICRDVGADAEIGRIYLPQEDIRRFDVSEEEILRKEFSSAFRKLMRFQARRAWEHLKEADPSVFGRECRKILPAEIMKAVYRRLLMNIECADYRVLDRRIRVSKPRKIFEALRVFIGMR